MTRPENRVSHFQALDIRRAWYLSRAAAMAWTTSSIEARQATHAFSASVSHNVFSKFCFPSMKAFARTLSGLQGCQTQTGFRMGDQHTLKIYYCNTSPGLVEVGHGLIDYSPKRRPSSNGVDELQSHFHEGVLHPRPLSWQSSFAYRL